MNLDFLDELDGLLFFLHKYLDNPNYYLLKLMKTLFDRNHFFYVLHD